MECVDAEQSQSLNFNFVCCSFEEPGLEGGTEADILVPDIIL